MQSNHGDSLGVSGLELDTLMLSADTTCILDEGLVVSWHNPAWLTFARQNQCGEMPSGWPIGCAYTAAISPPLDSWFRENLQSCLDTGEIWRHTYECSSPALERRFKLIAYPLENRRLLLVHSLQIERPWEDLSAPVADFDDEYRDAHGLAHQCMHCRRMRHAESEERWDWIPRCVEEIPFKTSHDICFPCKAHYYPTL